VQIRELCFIVLPDTFQNLSLLAVFAFAWLSFIANVFNSTLILGLSGCGEKLNNLGS